MQRDSETTFRLFRQRVDRRRPSKRQTTLRSFKIATNWNDGSSQPITSSSRVQLCCRKLLHSLHLTGLHFSNNKQTCQLSTIHLSPIRHHEDTSEVSSSAAIELAPTSALHITHDSVVLPSVTIPRSVSLQQSPVLHSRVTSDDGQNLVASEIAQRRHLKQSSGVSNERASSPSLEKPLSEKATHTSPDSPRKTTKGRKRRQKVVDVVRSNENEAAEDEDKESAHSERAPSPSLEKPLSEKTAHSSPGAPRKTTKGRKRRQKVVDVVKSNENEAAEDEDKESAHNERTPSPSMGKPLSEKTPHSGPGALKTEKGRKRRRKEVDVVRRQENKAAEDEYRENNFVRLFNANQGRKRNMNEITDLDVILTAAEEETLEVRDQIDSATGKQAVNEFFIQMRQSFCETIDMSKENRMLKLDLQKAKSKVTKLRKELLSVQQKRSSITAQLVKEKAKYELDNKRQETLKDFSSFLKQLETLHKEYGQMSSKKPSKLEAGASCCNLPSLLIGGHSLLAAASQLKSINDSLQD